MLKVKQVATRLNLSVAKVYELIESKALPHFRFDGAIRVSEEQIEEYLNRCRVDQEGERKPAPHPKLKHIKT